MELISQIPLVGGALGVLIPFLIVLTVVVFVHEFGHYIVGRWCGIGAEVFSIGFGKPLFGWTDRRGTRWQVAALPLGGYVKFTGDMDPASAGKADESELSDAQRRAAFHNAPLWARASTVLAGPMANFLLSILIFAMLAIAIGRPAEDPVIAEVTEQAPTGLGFEAGDRVISIGGESVSNFAEIVDLMHKSDGETLPATVERDGEIRDITVTYRSAPTVDSITPGMAAAQAGIVPGDRILSIEGEPVDSFYEVQLIAAEIEPDTPVEMVIERGGEEMSFTFTPDVMERPHPVTGERVPQPTFGIRSSSTAALQPLREPMGPFAAVGYGADQTWMVISGTVSYLSDMIFANADTSQLGGPIRIAEISGDKAEEGASSLIWLIAMLSTSIGLLNLFPIPVLDGGHLMFYAVEALRGRPLGENWMQIGNMIGLSLVLFLMVFATYNDLARVWSG